MGWMDTKTKTEIDPTQRAAINTSLMWADNAARQPFQQYGGQWHAGLTGDQRQGFSLMRNSGNVGAPEINQAQDITRGVSRYSPTAVGAGTTRAGTGSQFMGQYFNPFLSKVAGGMIDEMGRARSMQMISDEDKALAAGAYGGSRHGVMDAETTRGFYDTLGKNLGSLYSQGFDTSARLGMADADRTMTSDIGNADRRLSADTFNVGQQTDAQRLRLGAGDLLARTGQQEHDNYTDWGRNMLTIGGLQQADQQAFNDSERARFNEWRDYPMKQSQIINQAVHGMPSMGATETQSPSMLGGAGSLLGMAGAAKLLFGGGAAAGGAGAAAAAGLLGMSDENVKSGISYIDEDDALEGLTKTPVKKWHFDPAKGGPDDGGKPHIGPMAQDVKRNLGIGDGSTLPVMDMLGAHHAAISALAKKVGRVSDAKVKRIVKVKKRGKVSPQDGEWSSPQPVVGLDGKTTFLQFNKRGELRPVEEYGPRPRT